MKTAWNGVPQVHGGLAPFGRYQLIATLGGGGMADVFLAAVHDPMGWNKLAVVKRLRPSLQEDPGLIAMFFDEARLAARLAHPNVVNTYEVGETDGEYFLAMEYLDGQPLNRIVKEAAPGLLSDVAWVWMATEALAGLHYAHEARDYDGTPMRIVHRDISPHNLFVTYGGQVKIVDFGIAKAALNATQTQDGVLKGKFGYMAPEQARGGAVDRRADVFSMGVVLWELVARRRLHTGEPFRILQRLLTEPLPRLRDVRPDVDERLANIVEKATAKDPNRRFGSALEMQTALLEWLGQQEQGISPQDVGRILSAQFRDVRERVTREIHRHAGSSVALMMNRTPSSTAMAALAAMAPSTRVPSAAHTRAAEEAPRGSEAPTVRLSSPTPVPVECSLPPAAPSSESPSARLRPTSGVGTAATAVVALGFAVGAAATVLAILGSHLGTMSPRGHALVASAAAAAIPNLTSVASATSEPTPPAVAETASPEVMLGPPPPLPQAPRPRVAAHATEHRRRDTRAAEHASTEPAKGRRRCPITGVLLPDPEGEAPASVPSASATSVSDGATPDLIPADGADAEP